MESVPFFYPSDCNVIFLLFQAKQLCLTIVRTSILERRPVPLVSRAIDVLVTSYSQSIKTGSYYKRMKVENTSVSNTNNSNTTVRDATNPADAFGKYSMHETMSSVENETTNKARYSNTADNLSIETQKMEALNLDPSSGKTDGASFMKAEASVAELHSSSAHSQIVGQGDVPLNTNVSEVQESQSTSAAVSPEDLYSSVFALVEEEMAGDASYLVAIIVEFLRRFV